MATCTNCGLHFANRQQLGAHRRTCRRHVVAIPANVPVGTLTLYSMCRRPTPPWGRVLREVRVPDRDVRVTSPYVRDYRELQSVWTDYVKLAHGCCDTSFWTVFNTVRKQTTTCIDEVISVVKDLLCVRGQRWPRSCRIL